jgi:hypothetical protein
MKESWGFYTPHGVNELEDATSGTVFVQNREEPRSIGLLTAIVSASTHRGGLR